MTRGKAIGIVLLVALSTWGYIYKAAPKMVDIEVPYRAGVRALQAEPLYQDGDGHYVFKYLPAYALFAIPLGLLPLPLVKASWFALSVAMLVLLIWLNLKLPVTLRKPPAWLSVFTVIVLGKFYVHDLVLGQMNYPFAILLTLALLSIKAGRELIAGILVVLAIVVKPYAVIFVPWMVARGKLASTAAVCAGFVAVLLLPAVVYGVSGDIALHQDWWHMVTSTTAPNLTTYDNVGLAAVFFRYLGPGETSAYAAYATGLVLLAVAAGVFLARRGISFPEGLEGGLLLTLIPLLSPQGWDYVFLIATPAIVYIINYEDLLPLPLRVLTGATLVTIGLSLFDVMGRTAYYAFMRLSGISICFGIVIGIMCVIRARRIA
jgi:hypothetical protein